MKPMGYKGDDARTQNGLYYDLWVLFFKDVCVCMLIMVL